MSSRVPDDASNSSMTGLESRSAILAGNQRTAPKPLPADMTTNAAALTAAAISQVKTRERSVRATEMLRVGPIAVCTSIDTGDTHLDSTSRGLPTEQKIPPFPLYANTLLPRAVFLLSNECHSES